MCSSDLLLCRVLLPSCGARTRRGIRSATAPCGRPASGQQEVPPFRRTGKAKEAAAAADSGLSEVGIVNLQRESLADGLARLAPGGVDIVIDALGGPITGQAVGGLARGGRAVVMGYSAGPETTMRVTDLVWKLAHVSGFSLFAASAGEQAEAYATVLPLIAAGQITPAHDRSFPLEQAPEALRHLIEDRPFGKVTLTVDALSICGYVSSDPRRGRPAQARETSRRNAVTHLKARPSDVSGPFSPAE